MTREKIFIEGTPLVEGHFSGVGQYTLGIMRGLDSLIEKAVLNGATRPEIYVFIPKGTLPRFKTYNFKYLMPKVFPLSFRIFMGLHHRDKLPPIDLILGKGMYIFTRFTTMPLAFSKSAVVVYDLSFELYRQYSDEKNAQFLASRVRKSVPRAKKIITISQSARNEIIDFYNLPKDKVVISTPAADLRYFYRRSVKEIEKVKRTYGIEGEYILALSNLEPRKNLESLVDAYCNLPKKIRDSTGLLLVGVSGWKTERLFQKIIGKVQDGYNIMRPSHYVLDEDKPAIISGAKMLVYPSHYEGFGMPPLEALACGVPVIAADNSSLPEVIGDAGTLVPSDDIKNLTKKIEGLIKDITNITNSTITKGPKQARTFSWEKSAQTYLDIATEIAK